MKKTNKKGFTIVELVIVIAVIAILAGVLIPTFSNVIQKANMSRDLQQAKNAFTDYLIEQKADDIDGAVSGTYYYVGKDYVVEISGQQAQPVNPANTKSAKVETGKVMGKTIYAESDIKNYSIATGGVEGVVKVYGTDNPLYKLYTSLELEPVTP